MKEERKCIACGITGWFFIIHFSLVLINIIFSELAVCFILIDQGTVDANLTRNAIFSLARQGIPTLFMILLGITLLIAHRRHIRRFLLESSDANFASIDNHGTYIKNIVFTTVGMLLFPFSIYSIVITTVYEYGSLSLLFNSSTYFKHILLFVMPAYLIAIVEGIIGLILLITFIRKNSTIDNKAPTIEA